MSTPPELPKQDFATIDNLYVERKVEGPGFDRFAIRVITMIAGAELNGHRFVAANAEGKAVHADTEHPSVIGLIVSSATTGESVEVVVFGPVTHSGWSWSEGEVFLGPGGRPVQNVPVGFGVLAILGKTLCPDTMLVSIESPIFNP